MVVRTGLAALATLLVLPAGSYGGIRGASIPRPCSPRDGPASQPVALPGVFGCQAAALASAARARLSASDGNGYDNLGFAIASSSDGSIVAVGAPDHMVHGIATGAVYVFVKSASGWASATQTAELTASDGASGDTFGTSVAISSDGSTIVVGSPKHNLGGNIGQGAVYVFQRGPSGWATATQTAELSAVGGAAGDQLGDAVAISGTTIAAGADFRQVNSNLSQGAVYVFTETAANWSATSQAVLTASDGGAGDQIGAALAMSGGTIVAGAPYHDVGANANQGAAYVFEALPSGWTSGSQNAELTAPDGAADDSLGSAVAISGSTIVATAIGHKIGANDAQGAGYVYTQPAGGWASTNQAAELTASDGGDNDELGYSAAIQGSTVVLGAPYHDDPSGTAVGAAYLYAEPSAGWRASTETQQLLPGPNDAPGSGLGFGESAAIGGPVVAVGSSYNDPAHPGGTAYAFVNPPGYVNSVPTVSIKSPQNGADYAQGQVIHAQYSCAAAPPATLASCVGSVPDGALIDTTDPGSHTVSVTATDSNGVIVSQSVTYAVHAILPGRVRC